MTNKKNLVLIVVIIVILISSAFLLFKNKWQIKKILLNNSQTSQNSTNNQTVEKPTPAEEKKIEKITLPKADTLEQTKTIIEDWIKNQPTYKFDGQNLTLKQAIELINNSYRLLYNFETENSGYGNRSKQKIEKITTPHLVEITTQDNRVLYALIDGRWDEVEQKMIR